jgi:hypothetical protein
MLSFTTPRYGSTYPPKSRRKAYAMLLAIALSTTQASAVGGDSAGKARRATSGEGVPAWVVQECRPATGAEIMGRFAGAGYWFYRATGDFCYSDLRPNVL